MDEEHQLHRDKEAAAEMAVNAIIKYLQECDVEGDQQKREWLQGVFDRVFVKVLTH
jgi:hypothetical protein